MSTITRDTSTTERAVAIMEGAEDELANLRAENNMLKGVLAQQPDMRAIVGELRSIHRALSGGYRRDARERLADLLRRLDESR